MNRHEEQWLRKQIPLSLPREQLARVHSRSRLSRGKDHLLALLMLIAFWIVFGLVALVMRFFGTAGDEHSVVTTAGILAGAFVLALAIPLFVYVRRGSQRRLAAALRSEGYEFCVACNHCLIGVRDDLTRCPECGANREQLPEARR